MTTPQPATTPASQPPWPPANFGELFHYRLPDPPGPTPGYVQLPGQPKAHAIVSSSQSTSTSSYKSDKPASDYVAFSVKDESLDDKFFRTRWDQKLDEDCPCLSQPSPPPAHKLRAHAIPPNVFSREWANRALDNEKDVDQGFVQLINTVLGINGAFRVRSETPVGEEFTAIRGDWTTWCDQLGLYPVAVELKGPAVLRRLSEKLQQTLNFLNAVEKQQHNDENAMVIKVCDGALRQGVHSCTQPDGDSSPRFDPE